MKIEQVNNDRKGYFSAIENEIEAGRMVYTWAGPGKIIIEHTQVESAFSSKGVGKEMVLAAVKFARDTHIKVLPLCPYAKSVFDKQAELQDVLF